MKFRVFEMSHRSVDSSSWHHASMLMQTSSLNSMKYLQRRAAINNDYLVRNLGWQAPGQLTANGLPQAGSQSRLSDFRQAFQGQLPQLVDRLRLLLPALDQS